MLQFQCSVFYYYILFTKDKIQEHYLLYTVQIYLQINVNLVIMGCNADIEEVIINPRETRIVSILVDQLRRIKKDELEKLS